MFKLLSRLVIIPLAIMATCGTMYALVIALLAPMAVRLDSANFLYAVLFAFGGVAYVGALWTIIRGWTRRYYQPPKSNMVLIGTLGLIAHLGAIYLIGLESPQLLIFYIVSLVSIWIYLVVLAPRISSTNNDSKQS